MFFFFNYYYNHKIYPYKWGWVHLPKSLQLKSIGHPLSIQVSGFGLGENYSILLYKVLCLQLDDT